MSDYTFLKNSQSGQWVVSAPRRSQRTNLQKQSLLCPFCLGMEHEQSEVYRVGGERGDSDWNIMVFENKYPFTPYHEVIVHSPDHHKNFDELPFTQVKLILETYKQRMQFHKNKGYVYIFHNRGRAAGESIPHPHSQLTVIPESLIGEIPVMNEIQFLNEHEHALFTTAQQAGIKNRIMSQLKTKRTQYEESLRTEYFHILCPKTSEWPDEVWIAPIKRNRYFRDIDDATLTDLAYVLTRVIQIFDLRHGHEFPFNFYIYPGQNWYLRLIPRIKILGGFELGTKVMVNTQEPSKTMSFIKEHFWTPDYEKINMHDQADYVERV